MKHYKKLTTVVISFALILSSTWNVANASEDKNNTISNLENTKSVEVEIFATDAATGKPSKRAWAYTVNSTYNPTLGCITPADIKSYMSFADTRPVYPCNMPPNGKNNLSTISSNTSENLTKTQQLIKNLEKFTPYNQMKLNQKTNKYSKTLKITSETVFVVLCNEQYICEAQYHEGVNLFIKAKKPIQFTWQLPKLVELSDSQLVFSRFNDGKNMLENFISEINSIEFISAYNTSLFVARPNNSPAALSDIYMTKVPLRTSKVEICTTYKYCFTTKLDDSVQTYLETKKPARTFEISITNATLANYQRVAIVAGNANFRSNNISKVLTLKYGQKDVAYTDLSVVTKSNVPTTNLRIHKTYREYKGLGLCDDISCLPVVTLDPSACPPPAEICLSASFELQKKSTLIYGYLLQPDGSPAPYASIRLSSSDYALDIPFTSSKANFSDKTRNEYIAKVNNFERGVEYELIPSYSKTNMAYSDEKGMVTFTMDLDHYFSLATGCNLNGCYPVSHSLFDQSKYEIPNQGNSLLFKVPSNSYDYFVDADEVDPIYLKPGLIINSKLLSKFPSAHSDGFSENVTKLFYAPGSYILTFDRDGKLITRTSIDSKGNFTLTLPETFHRMDICDVMNKCQSIKTYKKIYYLTLDPDTISEKGLTTYTFPAPTDRLGILKGILYDAKKRKVTSNGKLYLFNDKHKLTSTLTTNAKGEFTTTLTSIQSNRITRIQGCAKIGDCDFNPIQAEEVNNFINEQLNFPFQVVTINKKLR